jgi:hypothetical protein
MANRGQMSGSGFHFYSDYQKCQQYFYWRYVKNLDTKFKAPPLIFGTAVHAALESWYIDQMNGGKDLELRKANALQTFIKSMEAEEGEYAEHDYYIIDRDRGFKLVSNYFDQYPDDERLWKILAVEESVQMVLPTGDIFTGTVDLKVQIDGRIYIVDHKTTGWGMSQCMRSLEASDQSTGYTMIHNVMHPDQEAVGLIYNVLRSVKSVTEYSRTMVVKPKSEQKRFAREIADGFGEIVQKMGDPNACFRRNTQNCFAYNRACPYLELCQGAPLEALMGYKFKISEEKPTGGEEE